MGFLKKTKFLAVCAVSFMALTFVAATCSAKGGGSPEHTQVPKKILFITSFAKSHTWTKNIISGLEQYLDRADYPVDVSVLELGVLRTPNGKPIAGAYEKAMDIVRQKKPDIVAVCDMPAIELFEGHYTDELKDIPVVLCGFPSGIEFSHEKYPNSAVVMQQVDILGNVELALKLFPRTSEIAVVTDSTAEGQGIERKAREQLADFDRAEVKYISGREYDTDDMYQTIKSMPKDSIVLFVNWKSAKPEIFQSQEDIVKTIGEYAGCPIFTTSDLDSPQVFGGIVSRGILQGESVARAVNSILIGASPESLRPLGGTSETMINWKAVRKYGVDDRRLPAGAIIYGKPKSAWEAYKLEISLISVAFVFMALWIVSVSMRYRAAKRNEFIYGKLPVRISAYDKSGKMFFSHFAKNDSSAAIDAIGGLYDFPESLRAQFGGAVDFVRSTGEEASVNYDFDGQKRKGKFIKLPSAVFGSDAVMLVSVDVSELDSINKKLLNTVEHLDITINSIGDGVIATDPDERITHFNPVSEALTGYSKEEAVGRKLDDIFNIVSYIDDSRVPSPVTKAIRTKSIVALANHTDLISKNGGRRHIADSAAPILDASGTLQGAVLVFRDVTQDYRKRDEIVTKNTLLKYATEIADMSYFVCDETLALKEANIDDYSGKFWGRRDGESVRAGEWVYHEDLDEFRKIWDEFKSGKSEKLDASYRSNFTGTMRYFHMHVVKRPVHEGKSFEYFGIIQDVTRYKENEFMYKDAMRFINSILDNIPCAIFVKNLSDGGRYVLASKFFREYVNYKGESLNGKTDFDIFPRDAAERYIADDMRIAGSGEILDIIEEVPNPGGEPSRSHTLKTSISTENGDTHLIGISLDVTELIRTQDYMRSYIEQERIINECLNLVLSSDDNAFISNGILRTIGEQIGADRCYIFEYDDARGVADNSFEWCAGGIEPQIDTLRNVPLEMIADWTAVLLKRGVIRTDNLCEDESDEFRGSRTVLESQDIKTLLVTGIWAAGKLWGFIGVDFVKTIHKFTAADENMLKSAARIFELYLERRRNVEALEQREAEKEMILNSIQIPVMLFDADGRLVSINGAAEKIADGKDRNLILSEPCHINYCDGRFVKGGCPVRACLRDSKECVVELNLRGRDYLTSASPVFDKNGKIINVVESCVDLTDFYRSRRELEKAMEAVKAADKAKSYFLATVSHELRTPLNAVIGYSELSQDDNLSPAERSENLENIGFAANALLTLVNDVLDLSKLEAGQMEIEKSSIDLNSLMRNLVRVFKYSAEKKGIKIGLNFVGELPPALMLDSLRIKQVLMNIIGNAVKFTDEGGVRVDVSFTPVGTGDGSLKITVTDSGMGISKSFMSKIFNPFERQPAESVRGKYAYKGTGLGLAIAKRLVEKMGGDILVKSELGKGSVFTIALENVKVSNLPAKNTDDFLAVGPAQGPKFKGNVVIVDDVQMNLKVLGAILTRIGVGYKEFSTGREALEYIKSEPVSLVLTDIWMSEMSGSDLAAALKAAPETFGIPVVAVTADTQVDSANFDGILFKPITIQKESDIVGRFAG